MATPNYFSSYGPFATRDVLKDACLKYLEVPDILRAARVCKRWKELFSNQELWRALFEREGIPLVQSTNRQERDYKKDFKILCPITIRASIISQVLGKVIEKAPPISEENFEKLKQPDPFKDGKLILDNFVIVVVPAFISRSVDKETPLALDEKGNLKELTMQESEPSQAVETKLKIPLSLKNIFLLCKYPLKGKENLPVFQKYSELEIFKQSNDRPEKISLYLMRRDCVEIDTSFLQQQKRVREKGFEVTPFRVRVLFDALNILLHGECLDTSSTPPIYSRHPERVHNDGPGLKVDQVVIGDYKHGSGLLVRRSKRMNASVAPGIPLGVDPSPTSAPVSQSKKRKSRTTKPPR